jgi:hypothetical protein
MHYICLSACESAHASEGTHGRLLPILIQLLQFCSYCRTSTGDIRTSFVLKDNKSASIMEIIVPQYSRMTEFDLTLDLNILI